MSRQSGHREYPAIDIRRLWSGGAVTALVAALVALAGVLIARGLFDAEVIAAPDGDPVTILRLASTAAVSALAATAVLHLLLRLTPQPMTFFTWIAGLAITIAVLWPFATDAATGTKVATALVNAAIGLCIASLVSMVAASASRRARTYTDPDRSYP